MSKITATLKRGKVYYLGTQRFERGVGVTVTEKQRAQLVEDPVRIEIVDDGERIVETRSRFDFSTHSESEPVPARARSKGGASVGTD